MSIPEPPAVTDADVAAFCRGARLQRPAPPLRDAIVAGLAEVLATRKPVVAVEREPAPEDVPWRNFDPFPRPRSKRED